MSFIREVLKVLTNTQCQVRPGAVAHIPCDLVSISEASAFARIARETISRWIGRGLLNVWGRPGCYRVSLAEILPHAIAANHAESDPSKPGPKRRKLGTAQPRKPPGVPA